MYLLACFGCGEENPIVNGDETMQCKCGKEMEIIYRPTNDTPNHIKFLLRRGFKIEGVNDRTKRYYKQISTDSASAVEVGVVDAEKEIYRWTIKRQYYLENRERMMKLNRAIQGQLRKQGWRWSPKRVGSDVVFYFWKKK